MTDEEAAMLCSNLRAIADGTPIPSALRMAADEIERLREELDDASQTLQLHQISGDYESGRRLGEKAIMAYIKEKLLKQARLYQADDGSPGPLSGCWGWRDIAEHLREAAEAAGGDGD